jgi:Fic family protein
MDHTRFTVNKTGMLVRIETDISPDWSFVPDMMPSKWTLPTDMYDLAMEAWGCLEKLDGIGHTLPNPQLLLRPLEDREAIQSSKLEGTYASAKELLLFAQSPRDAKSATDPANDWREVYNYREALRYGNNSLADRPVSVSLIREMHAILMQGVRGKDKNPGTFRTTPVGIGTPHYRFIPPPPHFVIDLLENFAEYANGCDKRPRDKLIRPFIAHYQFETIHPFSDGNGRIGRALLALMVHRCCGHMLPWLYLSPFFERNKSEYVNRLFMVSANGEWSQWIEFCLQGTIEQAKDAINRCRMLLEIRKEYMKRIDGFSSPRTHKIIERLFRTPILGIAELRKELGVSYQTARSDCEKLVEARILREIGNYQPTSFVASAIFSVAYNDKPSLEEALALLPPREQADIAVDTESSQANA